MNPHTTTFTDYIGQQAVPVHHQTRLALVSATPEGASL